jgi:hypothetical protein
MIRKLFKAAEQAAIERDITNFRATGLREALNIEKKKRQRGKALNILGLSSTGAGLFVSGEKINDTKTKQKNKETVFEKETIKKKTQKEQDEVSKQLRKDQEGQDKETKKARKVEQAEVSKQVKAKTKKIVATATRAAKKTKNAAKKAAPKPKPSKIVALKLGSTVLQSLGSHKVVEIDTEDVQKEVVGYMIRKGKQIILL